MKSKIRKIGALLVVMLLLLQAPIIALGDADEQRPEQTEEQTTVEEEYDEAMGTVSDESKENEQTIEFSSDQDSTKKIENIALKKEIPDVIDVVVPAIWYPVDKDTNEMIPGLNPIPTYPDMYDRPEVAKLNKDKDIYEIDYMGVPKPDSPGSWSANNFMYTSNLFFTDRFHRVVAQGYGTFKLDEMINGELWQPGSSVRWLEYGDFTDTAPFDEAVNRYKGLLGIGRTEYQEGETLKLYITAKPDAALSEPTFKASNVDILLGGEDSDTRETLISNIEKVTYFDVDAVAEVEFNLETIKTMYLYRYDSDDENKGSFITDEMGNYKNFMEESFANLPVGEYEVVFPIYWQKALPDMYSSSKVFSRNRYKFDDTFHFGVSVSEAPKTYTVTYTDGVDNEVVFKDQAYEDIDEGSATPAFNGTPTREGYTFKGWEPEVASTVTADVVYTAVWGKDETPTPTTPEPTKPIEPKPEKPSPGATSPVVKTGDSSNVGVLIIILIISGLATLGVAVATIYKKRKQNV
jgi:hypothetical protein